MTKEVNRIANRMFLVFGVLLLIPMAIGLQILRVQWVEGAGLRTLWSEQTLEVLPIPAERGRILDIEGRELVGNTVSYTLAVDPLLRGVSRADLSALARELSNRTGRTVSHYEQRLRSAPPTSRYVVLERGLSAEVADGIRQLGMRGVILEEHYSRRYNYESLAAHILGYVDHRLSGVSGLEASYNRYLQGTDGMRQVRRVRTGGLRSYVGAPRKQPEQGHTIVTTIDAHLQAIAEEELEKGVRRARGDRGSIIIVDPSTGAIRALANYPAFNPNRPGEAPAAHRRNAVVSDLIEPGSTFKLVTAVAALEQKVVALDEQFDTGSGTRMISGQVMRDHDPMGVVRFDEAIRRSSNIATSEVAGRIPPETFYQYIRNLGFGTPTNIDLPGEESGRLRKPYEWSRVTQPWLSIGYEMQVTLLQLVQAYAAFANNGELMRPYVVDRVVDQFGRTIHETRPQRVRRAIKPETIHTLNPVFESVVSDSGTASLARVDGLRAAGKTGTAQKFIDGRYQARYRASFAGYFPAEDPRYVALIMIDEPRISYYGGFISGPVFRNVAVRLAGIDEQVLQSDNGSGKSVSGEHVVVPDITGMQRDAARAVLELHGLRSRFGGEGTIVSAQSPAPGTLLMRPERVQAVLDQAYVASREEETSQAADERVSAQQDRPVPVPDVRQKPVRTAVLWLEQAGFEVEIIGSGQVHAQFPEPGALYRTGRTVTIRGRNSAALTARLTGGEGL